MAGWYEHLVVRGQDATNHPTQGSSASTQSFPATNVNSAKVGKP